MNNENIKSNVWKAGFAVAILLAVFLLILSIKEIKRIPYVGRDVPIMNAITVSGKGEAVSVPNVATFSFGVTETAKTVGEAQIQATTKTNNALKALKDAKIEDKDIKTIAYTINPHYEYQNGPCTVNYCQSGKSTLTGYDVSQTIEVKVRKLDDAGAIFTKIGELGVQNVSGLSFSIDDIETVKGQARELAIENAKQKAEDLSRKLGVKLVRITSFYDQTDDQVYYGRDAMMSESANVKVAAMPVPSIPSGEQKVTARVSITYEIR